MLKTIPTTQPIPAHSPTIGSTPMKPLAPSNNKVGSQKMKSILAVAALIVFVGVASLAVLISQKQQGGAPVAPNAPESKPQAFIEKPATCSLTFEIPAQCNSVCMTTDDCQKVNPDWVCVVPPYEATPSGAPTPSVSPSVTKYCRLKENPASPTCELSPTPTPTVTPTPTDGPTPTPTPTPTEGPTPTPTPTSAVTPTPTEVTPTPTMPPGITVNPTTPGEPPTYTVVTTVDCNESCSKNSDCANAAHICYNGACRLDSNPEDAYCRLKTGETKVVVNVIPTKPPVIKELPVAGPADWGTYLKVGFGALGIGALLLLFL